MLYRAILHTEGMAAIEDGVRIRFAGNVHFGRAPISITAYIYTLVPLVFGSGPSIL